MPFFCQKFTTTPTFPESLRYGYALLFYTMSFLRIEAVLPYICVGTLAVCPVFGRKKNVTGIGGGNIANPHDDIGGSNPEGRGRKPVTYKLNYPECG